VGRPGRDVLALENQHFSSQKTKVIGNRAANASGADDDHVWRGVDRRTSWKRSHDLLSSVTESAGPPRKV
jgi:hypothetical protein